MCLIRHVCINTSRVSGHFIRIMLTALLPMHINNNFTDKFIVNT